VSLLAGGTAGGGTGGGEVRTGSAGSGVVWEDEITVEVGTKVEEVTPASAEGVAMAVGVRVGKGVGVRVGKRAILSESDRELGPMKAQASVTRISTRTTAREDDRRRCWVSLN